MLERELYLRGPGKGNAPWHNLGYVNATGLERVEIVYHTTGSDEDRDWITRTSKDNGKTWSPFSPMPDIVTDTPQGGIAKFLLPARHNPYTGDSYRFSMVRHWPGLPCFDYRIVDNKPVYTEHVFVSENGGPERMLRYEKGPNFDPADPFNLDFFNTNTAYYSHFPAFAPSGEVFYAAHTFGHPRASHRRICLFRREPGSGEWKGSNVIGVTLEQSSVGLEEAEVVRLRDGRLCTVVRGQSTETMTGVKWCSLSTDGGKTLLPLQPLRYDDGTLVHSPCSIHRFLRSTKNGRLYWFANIMPEPVTGQEPRYPLCIAEIDEEKAAVKRGSVQVLDDRRDGEPARLQISNFAVIEDRATLNFELYVTLLGLNADDFWGCDVYRYFFTPPAS